MKAAAIVPAAKSDLPALAKLAGVIWRQHYPSIISSAQIEYMLGQMYSLEVLREEIDSKGVHFYRLLEAGCFIGFASIGPTATAGTFKLHKLYLLPEYHGRGFGRSLLNHCQLEAIRFGANRLILAVNKQNAKAVMAYQRNGFAIVESVVTDIGQGFVMDDYLMAKDLVPAQAT